MSKKWETSNDSETWHVIPLNDVKQHSKGIWCACQPMIEESENNGNVLVTHNAYDGREFFEGEDDDNEEAYMNPLLSPEEMSFLEHDFDGCPQCERATYH